MTPIWCVSFIRTGNLIGYATDFARMTSELAQVYEEIQKHSNPAFRPLAPLIVAVNVLYELSLNTDSFLFYVKHECDISSVACLNGVCVGAGEFEEMIDYGRKGLYMAQW